MALIQSVLHMIFGSGLKKNGRRKNAKNSVVDADREVLEHIRSGKTAVSKSRELVFSITFKAASLANSLEDDKNRILACR